MKTAVVCDFIADKGGAERIILALSEILDADIITTHYIPKNTYAGFSKRKVIFSPLKTYPTPLLMQFEASQKFKSFDLSKYDVLISAGDYAKHIALNKTLRGKHINITMTIPRILTDLKPQIESQLSWPKRQIFRIWCVWASKEDKKAISKIKTIVTQSKVAKQRTESYYGVKTYPQVVYPAIPVKDFRRGKSRGYFLSVQRTMPGKNIEDQIEAFNKMPDKKLVIAGSTLKGKLGYLNELKKRANKNISFRSNISDKELKDLYAHCVCTIQTSIREDFGLIPLEGMASGKPCIAVNDGGFKETITKKTGILINKPYVDNLVKAVANFDEKRFKKSDLLKRVREFSEEAFVNKIKEIVEEAPA